MKTLVRSPLGDPALLVDGDRRLMHAQVAEIVHRVANQLLAADLGPERRVAVYAENSAETLLAHVGALLAGASSVPVNFHLTPAEAAFIVSDSGARLIFVGPENLDAGIAAARASNGAIVVAWGNLPPDCPAQVIPWATWLAESSGEMPPADITPRPSLMYTSGTTGTPKGVEIPPAMFVGGATVGEHIDRLAQSPYVQAGPHLVAGPMYHTGPLTAARMMVAGLPVSVLPRFDAERFLATVERDKITNSVMVPTHFSRLLALPVDVRQRYDVSSLTLVAHTGAACPELVKRAMIDWWGPVFREAYGGTESGTVCSITSAEWLERPGSVGRCLPGFDAVVVDDDGQPVPPGVPGRLYFRDTTGRGVIYRGDLERSAAAHLEPGVFTLGEIGYVDDDGYVFITDRFSDMVVSGGANLYPAEVEQVLVSHPDVADVAVIGVPDDDLGEQLKALVVAADPAAPPDPAVLLAFCRERLTSMKCPRSVEIVATVGRTAMGKVDKRALRAPFWSGKRTIGG